MTQDASTNQPPSYTPPPVWAWDQANGGRFANINRPVSGATHEQALPVGKHPLQLYSLGTPNGQKVTIRLEELLALGHALLDRSTAEPTRVFESGAIMVYLAEKFDAFLPKDGAARAECMSWLFWQMGSAPFVGGGFGHFYAYAPFKIEYAINRYAMETKRQMDVLNRLLAERRFVSGDDYTIADMAIWPWYGGMAKGLLYNAGEFLQVQDYTHVVRWADELAARPAVQRGRRVNKVSGDPALQLRERHDAKDFDLRPST